jgi:hypothetical protein
VRLWKIVGLATLAGVAAAGVAVQRKRRVYRSFDTNELRARLHARLAAADDSHSGGAIRQYPADSRRKNEQRRSRRGR